MPRGEEVREMERQLMRRVLSGIAVASLIALLIVSVSLAGALVAAQGLPSSEKFKVLMKPSYNVKALTPASSYSVTDSEKITIEFTKTYSLAAASPVVVIESVANPGKSRVELVEVTLSDANVPWELKIQERNSTTDSWADTYVLTNLIGSQRLDASLRTIKSLYFRVTIQSLTATTASATVHIIASIDSPVVDTVIGGVAKKGLAIPGGYLPNGTTTYRIVRVYATSTIKPLYDAVWEPITPFIVSWPADTGVTVEIAYVKTEIAGVTTDADTYKPVLKAGTEYTIKNIYDVNVTDAPGAFVDFIGGHASLSFSNVSGEAEAEVTWPVGPASYALKTPKLVEADPSTYYSVIVTLTGALIDNASVKVEPVYAGQSTLVTASGSDYVTYLTTSTTEVTLKWRTAFSPAVARYSVYDPSKTFITSVVKDDVVVFEAAPSIDSAWVRLYDKSGNLKLEAKGLEIGYSVPVGEYTERIIYSHEGVAHYAVESAITVRDYPVLEKIYTSPYSVSGKVTIGGQTVDLNTKVSIALKPGVHKAELSAGVFSWDVRSHSALANVFEVSLPFRKAEWTSGSLKLAEVYANSEGLTLTADSDMPRKVFHLSVATGQTSLTKVFVTGKEPLRVIVNGYEGKWSAASFNNTKGYVLDLPLNQTTYTIDVKYPAIVKLTIIDKDEKPVEGAKVKLEHYTGGVRDALYQATTDESGTVTFASVEPFATDYSLTITVSDYTTSGKILINDDVSKVVKLEIAAPTPPPIAPADYTTIFIVIVAVLAIVLSAYFIIKSRPSKAKEYMVRLEF
jgi:5-hydroxyisourate hydrolase-like protein (transthyretin family)